VKELGYNIIQIFGDSELLINLLNSEDYFRNPTLNKTLQRIWNTMKDFNTVDSYHILGDLNKQADWYVGGDGYTKSVEDHLPDFLCENTVNQ